MVLPLYAALDRLDKSLIEASLDLGAGHTRTLLYIVVPLALPGIISGVIITFVPALGAYLTPDLLGGPDSQMIANTGIWESMGAPVEGSPSLAMAGWKSYASGRQRAASQPPATRQTRDFEA